MRQVGRVGLAAAFGLMACTSAGATVWMPAELSDLASEARLIARGRVVAVEALVSDDRRSIETLVTLVSEAWLKGGDRNQTTVQFRVPGGRVGRYRRIVVGAPQFVLGQRVVVFLGGSAPRVPHVLGLSQGVYTLSADASGSWRVRGIGAAGMSLDAFERRVRTLAEAQQ
jgi:hypothetical protein